MLANVRNGLYVQVRNDGSGISWWTADTTQPKKMRPIQQDHHSSVFHQSSHALYFLESLCISVDFEEPASLSSTMNELWLYFVAVDLLVVVPSSIALEERRLPRRYSSRSIMSVIVRKFQKYVCAAWRPDDLLCQPRASPKKSDAQQWRNITQAACQACA